MMAVEEAYPEYCTLYHQSSSDPLDKHSHPHNIAYCTYYSHHANPTRKSYNSPYPHMEALLSWASLSAPLLSHNQALPVCRIGYFRGRIRRAYKIVVICWGMAGRISWRHGLLLVRKSNDRSDHPKATSNPSSSQPPRATACPAIPRPPPK